MAIHEISFPQGVILLAGESPGRAVENVVVVGKVPIRMREFANGEYTDIPLHTYSLARRTISLRVQHGEGELTLEPLDSTTIIEVDEQGIERRWVDRIIRQVGPRRGQKKSFGIFAEDRNGIPVLESVIFYLPHHMRNK